MRGWGWLTRGSGKMKIRLSMQAVPRIRWQGNSRKPFGVPASPLLTDFPVTTPHAGACADGETGYARGRMKALISAPAAARAFALPLLSILLPLLVPAVCRAGIDFENTTQQLTAKISESRLAASFPFSISGDKEVKIKDIHAFCSCLKAETKDQKMTFAPGAKGSIETLFEVGGFEGVLKKELVVTTDDPKQPEIRLVLEITIPALYDIKPSQLVWQAGGPAEAKSVTLKVLGDDPVHITAAVSSRNAMSATVKEITAGREYEVTVTPSSTQQKMLGLVRLELDSKYPRYQKRLVFFNITDKPQTSSETAPATPGGAASPAAAAPAAASPAAAASTAPVPAPAAPATPAEPKQP